MIGHRWHCLNTRNLNLTATPNHCAPAYFLSFRLGTEISTGVSGSMSSPHSDNARIHKVSEQSPWPHNLRDITSHLECALAPISNGTIDRLSPFAKRIYESESLHSVNPVSLQECPRLASLRPITDVLDTLLSTVQNLREIIQANIDDLPPRPTFSILLPLFSALGLGCSPDADIL